MGREDDAPGDASAASRAIHLTRKPLLIVHVGPGKTGSSAIQRYLLGNAGELASRRILYPLGADGLELAPFTGNALDLARLLTGSQEDLMAAAGAIDDELARYESLARRDNCDTVIVSSEFFGNVDSSGFELFKKLAAPRFDLRIVAMIRDPYWWLWSAWGQGVKRGGESESFRDFLPKHQSFFFDVILQLIKCFDDVRLVAYSEDRLIEDFGRATGVDLSGLGVGMPPRLNRSLSKDELAVLLLVNRTFADPVLSTHISNSMLAKSPDAVPYRYYDRELADLVRRSNAEALAAAQPRIVNPEVPIIETDTGFERNVEPDDLANLATQFDADLLKGILRSIRVAWGQQSGLALRTLQGKARRPAQLPDAAEELPPDFNEIEYLLLNEDVLLAGADPVEHYFQHGRDEGRPYCRPRPVATPTN